MPNTLYLGKNERIVQYENGVLVFENFSRRDIFSKNFDGEHGKNKSKERSFCLKIPEERLANKLASDGWNIHINPPRNDDEGVFCYVPVTVRYDIFPPKIICDGVVLNDETVSRLQDSAIKKFTLSIRPRTWQDDDGNTRVKAYVKEMRIELEISEIDALYAEREYPEE